MPAKVIFDCQMRENDAADADDARFRLGKLTEELGAQNKKGAKPNYATNANAPQSPTLSPKPAGTSSQPSVSAGSLPWI